jgi:hypothetical protein
MVQLTVYIKQLSRLVKTKPKLNLWKLLGLLTSLKKRSAVVISAKTFQVLADKMFSLQWRSQGFQSRGVKGRVREGCTPSRWGSGGCAPGKIFKLHMHAGEFKSNFHTKINTLTPVFMPLSFGKIFKLHMHAGEF